MDSLKVRIFHGALPTSFTIFDGAAAFIVIVFGAFTIKLVEIDALSNTSIHNKGINSPQILFRILQTNLSIAADKYSFPSEFNSFRAKLSRINLRSDLRRSRRLNCSLPASAGVFN